MVLGGQTCLLCVDEHGARWWNQTTMGGRGGWSAAVRRLHGSLIAEEAMSARNTTTSAAAATRIHQDTPRAIHMGPPIAAKGVVGNHPNQDLGEKLSQRLCNIHSFT